MNEYIMNNRAMRQKHNALFSRTFGVSLRKYWHPLFGLDIVKLDDDVIKPPDGTSTLDHVTATWGGAVADMITDLL